MTSCVHLIFNRGHGGSGPTLTDTSMNGTWIDKMRVGKGNKAPLSHGNIISVLDQGMEVFCYLDKVTMERDFHPSNQQVLSGESSRGGDNLLGQTWL